MTAQYTIKEAGYAFLYIANDNATQVDVYFDDVVMTQSKSNVIQSNEYYPFGMQTANSWTRENTTGNQFLSNGGTELNSLTQLYDLDFRNFDPILGRLHQVDPLADNYGSWSPYKYGFNNPVNWNDPSGAADSGFDPVGSAQGDFANADRYMNRMNSSGGMYGAFGDDDMGGSAFLRLGVNYWGSQGSPEFRARVSAYHEAAQNGGDVGYQNGQVGVWKDEAYVRSFTIGGILYTAQYAGVRTSFTAIATTQAGNASGNPFAERGPWLMNGQAILGFSQFALESVVHSSNRPRYYGPKEWTNYKVNAGRLSTRLGLAGVAVSAADGLLGKEGWQNHHTADVAIGLGLTGASWIASTATVAAFVPGLNIAVAVVGLTYFAVDLGVQIFSSDHKSITQKLLD